MSDLGMMFPIENWLTDEPIDPDLEGPIAKARAELAGQSESEVKSLWNALEGIIRDGYSNTGRTLPTYRSDIRQIQGRLAYVGRGKGDPHPDCLAAFRHLLTKKHNPLLLYLRSLRSDVRLATLTVLALFILREAADRNPLGALEASSLYDNVYAPLRKSTEIGINTQQLRRKGLEKANLAKKAAVSERNKKIRGIAQQRRNDGWTPGAIEKDLASRYDISARQIRRVLSHSD